MQATSYNDIFSFIDHGLYIQPAIRKLNRRITATKIAIFLFLSQFIQSSTSFLKYMFV